MDRDEHKTMGYVQPVCMVKWDPERMFNYVFFYHISVLTHD
jgi:hypothetical protein